MLKWIEATGRSDDAAITAALEQLGLERDEVSVEVLNRAKSGFLGLGGTPARVKVSYEVPDEPTEAPTPAGRHTQVHHTVENSTMPRHTQHRQGADKSYAATPAAAPAATPSDAGHTTPAGNTARAEQITAFLTGLMAHMSVNATPVVTENPQGGYRVVLEGTELGALIGRRGETLDAIQQLTNYAVNRGQSGRVRIHIDAESYRAKREEALERLANKVAEKVIKYRHNVTLEPMNAYERHVIHAALQDIPDVVTYSTGTEPNRRTVVAFSKTEHK